MSRQSHDVQTEHRTAVCIKHVPGMDIIISPVRVSFISKGTYTYHMYLLTQDTFESKKSRVCLVQSSIFSTVSIIRTKLSTSPVWEVGILYSP